MSGWWPWLDRHQSQSNGPAPATAGLDYVIVVSCPACSQVVQVRLGNAKAMPAFVGVTCAACGHSWQPKIREVRA